MNTKTVTNANDNVQSTPRVQDQSIANLPNLHKSTKQDFATIFFNPEGFSKTEANVPKTSGLLKEKMKEHKDNKIVSDKNILKFTKFEKEDSLKETGIKEEEDQLNGSSCFFLPNNIQQIDGQEIKSVKLIITPTDLEKIVACMRTQITPGGHEISLELSRSVLDGLRIKLSMNKIGSVEAELIASTERAKIQIDAHIRELSDMLRLRGIDLNSLTTSVHTNTQQQNKPNDNFQTTSQNLYSIHNNKKDELSLKETYSDEFSSDLVNEVTYSA